MIPEYKTDNKAVEKLLKDSNKLLKGILDKPISKGGGGGGRATPYQDSNGIPAFVTRFEPLSDYDYIDGQQTSTTVDTYVYKLGGSGGTIKRIITVTYTSTAKSDIDSVVFA